MRPSDATRASAARTKLRNTFYATAIQAAAWLAVSSLAFTVVAAAGIVAPQRAHASDDTPWVLSNAERREFLRAYAPIILKRADEDRDAEGRDWMTNFHFDGDRDFSNNKRHWMKRLPEHVDGRDTLEVRPTVYTSLVEVWDAGQKSLILTYYPYHAMDEERIHDWERVEMRIDGVVGAPLSGEEVAYVVVTEHKRHRGRKRGHSHLNFLTTSTGKHVLLLRAEWSNNGELRKNELRFVRDSWQKISKRVARNKSARVRINGAGRTKFHYAFVEESDLEAVFAWGAEPLESCNAKRMAAAVELDRVRMSKVKGIPYELQDIADLVATQWERAEGYEASWTGTKVIWMAEAMESDDAEISISAGKRMFRSKARNGSEQEGGGLIGSSWFFGLYHFNGERFEKKDEALEKGQLERAEAHPFSVERGWHQHEYFVHTGEKGKGRRHGRWLEAGWHEASRGGFDGRWRPLFAPQANPRLAPACRG